MMFDYRQLWAKSQPWHPLWKHLLDAAAVSLALPNPLSKFNWSDRETALIVGLHDIGKADPVFQHQVTEFFDRLVEAGFPKPCDSPCRHERLSARFLRQKLEMAGHDPYIADAIARAILAHHGRWDEAARGVGTEYEQAQIALCDMLEECLRVRELPKNVPPNLSAFGMRLSGHIVLSDWIASNEQFFSDPRLAGIDSPVEYLATAQIVAHEWIDEKLALDRAQSEGNPEKIVKTPRPIQQALLDNTIPPGLVIIEAPMGEGKTEAAWILAEKWRDHGCRGLYMALPTMATSDSLHRRYRDQYLKAMQRGEDAKLVHGMAWLRDDLEPAQPLNVSDPGDENRNAPADTENRELATAWFRPTRRAMLAAHGVGTVDQAMLAGMNVKFGFLRLYGLSGRALVIDEVHAYDAYMSAIICRLLQWCACLEIPVILLSATLSAKQRAAMIEAYGALDGDPGPEAAYPLITCCQPGISAKTIPANASSSRTLKIETQPGLLGDAKKSARLAEDLVKNGGCCCVILNTVKQAQKVFQELKNIPDGEKLLFHARFTAADRETITSRVLELFGADTSKRPTKFVLVATQVVEQSLDVDFDHMISELAPIDLLLQRSGRMHRHREREHDPVLHVLLPQIESGKPPKFGPSEIIYRRFPLLRTFEELVPKGRRTIQLPGSFRDLVEAVYGEDFPDTVSNDLEAAKLDWVAFQEDIAAQAGEFLLCEPMRDEFDPVGADEVGDDSDDGNGWRARTRLGLQDVMVIPLTKKQIRQYKDGDVHPRLVKWLYKRSVKIPPYHWPPKPAKGFDQPVLGKNRLRGVWLLPVKNDSDGWKWAGNKRDKKLKPYVIQYNSKTGLTHGEDK